MWTWASLWATIVCLTAPIGVATIWPMLTVAGREIAELDWIRTVPGLQLGVAFATFALLVYFPGWPLMSLLVERFILVRLFDVLHLRKPNVELLPPVHSFTRARWVFASAVAAWSAVGLWLAFAASPGILSQHTVAIALQFWLSPLMVLLSFAPGITFMLLTILFIVWRGTKRPSSGTEIRRNLLMVLATWPKDKQPPFQSPTMRALQNSIRSVAFDVRRLEGDHWARDPSQEWAQREFGRASEHLLVCCSWLRLPDEGSMERVRLCLVKFCDAFLVGDMSLLPRSQLAESAELLDPERRPHLVKSFGLLLLSIVYCTVPFLVMLVFRGQVGRLLPSGADSLLTLMYSLWVAIGLYVYIDYTSQQGGTTAIEVLKSILKR